MQYHVVFLPGTGGDGFVNLLEHANNVYTSDGEDVIWRIHKQTDSFIKFYSPNWTKMQYKPFRGMTTPDSKFHVINPYFTKLVAEDKNTVIPAHYEYFPEIQTLSYRSLLEKNRCVIHLYSYNYERVKWDSWYKNEFNLSSDPNKERFLSHDKLAEKMIPWFMDSGYFDCDIDIEQVWTSWDYLHEKLTEIGIDLDKKYYDEYMALISPFFNRYP
jgi:hypothetical protein